MTKKLLVYFIVSLFIILVGVQANKKFVLDEIDFPIVAKATSETMKPIYYRGEQTPEHIGLYHPTLYINSLAVFIKSFGYSETSVRFFGLVCTLLSAYLLILIFRMFKERSPTFEILLLGLFLLNPYTIANTTLPDIDSTVLPVALLLFIYLSLKYIWKEKRNTTSITILLGGVFALNLWTKLTTSLVIPFFVFALLLICGGDIKKSLLEAVKIAVIGATLFLVSYFIYCKILVLPFDYTFSFLVQSFFKGTNNNLSFIEKISNNFSNVKSFIFWLTIPLAFVYLLSLVGVFLDKGRDNETKIIKLITTTGLFVSIFYLGLIPPFGGFFKYPFPVFGLMILTIIFFYQRKLSHININKWLVIFLVPSSFLLENHFLKDYMFKNEAVFRNMEILLLAVLVVYILLNFKKSSFITKTILVYFLVATIGFQVSISRVQAISSYPTKYNYGQQGINETINYLKANTNRDEVIWSMKDIGFYVNNRYVENYGFFFDKKLNKDLEKMIKEGKVRYYVVTKGIGQDRVDVYVEIRDILEYNTTKEAEFGNFIIYKAK